MSWLLLLLLGGCRFHHPNHGYDYSAWQNITPKPAEQLEAEFAAWLTTHQVNTAGVGIIKHGQLVWEGYYGNQASGIPANEHTLFNVASITKTVTTETILRLVNQGRLSLDEPMSRYWIDPDLVDDEQVNQLTARMALQHRTGFLNWRFFANDGQLSFINQPGTQFGYSGEGTEYVAKYAAEKLNQPFEELVQQTIFEPLNMRDTFISNQPSNHHRIAKPLSVDGEFYGYYCRPEGYCAPENAVSVADDMVTTLRDYARFLIAAMRADGLNKTLQQQRTQISENLIMQKQPECSLHPDATCPEAEGYGLGWYVVEADGQQLVGHGGSDWSEMAQAYFYSGSHDGVIVFINAPSRQALPARIEALSILDPKSPKIHEYQRWLSQSKN